MKKFAAQAYAAGASSELVELLASLEEIAHVEPLEEAARILNLVCIAKGQPATFSAGRLLKQAAHEKVRLSVVLPEHFHVHRKNEAKPFADTPFRPMFPAGSDCLLLLPHAASEIYQARGSAVQLRRAACPAPDGTINSYVAAQPYPNISLFDLRIEREEIVRIIQEMPNDVNAIAVEPSVTALADNAPIGASGQATDSAPPAAASCANEAATTATPNAIPAPVIADAFGASKLNNWNASAWSRNMGDGRTKWLGDCRVSKGSPGGIPSTWNPIWIALRLQGTGVAWSKLDAIFRQTAFREWRDEWEQRTELIRG